MKNLLIILLPLLFASQAPALFEARVGYGVNTPSESSLSSGATMSTMSGFNVDGVFHLPAVPFGFGLRYESMGLDVSDPTSTYKTDMTRLALLLDYRFIDSFLYLGAIATIGFSNDLSVNLGAGGTSKYTADMTYSVGVEGGVSLGLLNIGAELGYNMAEYENPGSFQPTIPFDGIYAKALVGIGF